MQKFDLPINIQEIISKANIPEFSESLIYLDKQIRSRGFKITTREDSIQSVIEWDNKIIRLSLVNSKKRKLKVLWDLLHEFGHLLDNKPSNNYTQKLEREIRAWENAKIALVKLPNLKCFISEFDKYSHECIKTYKDIM